MTLGNMRELGVQNLIASCLNEVLPPHRADRCVELSGTPVPWFRKHLFSWNAHARFGFIWRL
jgi:hypothetical protein